MPLAVPTDAACSARASSAGAQAPCDRTPGTEKERVNPPKREEEKGSPVCLGQCPRRGHCQTARASSAACVRRLCQEHTRGPSERGVEEMEKGSGTGGVRTLPGPKPKHTEPAPKKNLRKRSGVWYRGQCTCHAHAQAQKKGLVT